MTGDVFNGLLLAFCLGVSFLLSGMEAGVFALSRLRVRRLVRTGNRSARLLQGWLDHPENFLWTIFLANTLLTFVILGLLFAWLHAALHQHHGWFAAAFAGVVFIFYALGDLLPKMLFQKFPNRLCLALARPFRFLHLALRPLVALVEWASARLLKWTGGQVFRPQLFGSRAEFRELMQETGQGITSDERAMVNRVLDLQNLTVRQVCIPLAIAETITADAPLATLFAKARESRHTRFPVWDVRDQRRRIVGLVDLDVVLYRADATPDRRVGEFVQPTVYLDEHLRVEEAMRRMQRAGQMLAVVMRGDRETGILSLQDVLSQVFGEVRL
ncbi:MAG: CNNM domain-containing protein [Limisphaerales bacterium]